MKQVAFGWNAPKMKEQFPALADDVAAAFDKDNEAMIRLHMRGSLSDGERDRVLNRIAKRVIREAADAVLGGRP